MSAAAAAAAAAAPAAAAHGPRTNDRIQWLEVIFALPGEHLRWPDLHPPFHPTSACHSSSPYLRELSVFSSKRSQLFGMDSPFSTSSASRRRCIYAGVNVSNAVSVFARTHTHTQTHTRTHTSTHIHTNTQVWAVQLVSLHAYILARLYSCWILARLCSCWIIARLFPCMPIFLLNPWIIARLCSCWNEWRPTRNLSSS